MGQGFLVKEINGIFLMSVQQKNPYDKIFQDFIQMKYFWFLW